MTLKKAPSARPCPGVQRVKAHIGGDPLRIYGLTGSGAAKQILYEKAKRMPSIRARSGFVARYEVTVQSARVPLLGSTCDGYSFP